MFIHTSWLGCDLGKPRDWTTLRLNLQYHWKTVLLWSMGIWGALVLACWLLVTQADAWTRGVAQPFPDGKATVVVHRFCLSRSCDNFSQVEWQREIRSGIAKWNAAGAHFHFSERAARSAENPCNTRHDVVIILYKPGAICAQDQVVFDDTRRRGIDWHGLSIFWPDTPRVYVKQLPAIENLRWTLLHELGHVVGLGHPDGAGQNVPAVMNLLTFHNELQPDDIAGIRALYGVRGGPSPGDHSYCSVTRPCGAGQGDCDSRNECQARLVCAQDRGALYGWEAIVDVCEAPGQGVADPDYCVYNDCGAGEGDCDPGQCTAGLVCVNDVGAQYGFPAHYDVCEAGGGVPPDPDYCVYNSCGLGDGDCDPGQCDEGSCIADVGAQYGLPAYYDVCEASPPSTSVSRFNGVWQFSYPDSPPGCSEGDTAMTCTIAQGLASSCHESHVTQGGVSSSGDLFLELGGRFFQGRLEGNRGSGTGRYYSQSSDCDTAWTARKQSSLTRITGHVCSTLRGLEVKDYYHDPGRWDITNPCAPWNGYAQVLHFDVVPLSPEGFDMDTGDMMIVQGNHSVTYDEDNPDITQALFWVDPQTQGVSTRRILPYRLTEEPYRISVIVGENTGINLRQPFTLYYDDKLVAIFE